MSYFNSKETAYSKLEYKASPAAYNQTSNDTATSSVAQSPMAPKTTHKRFEEPVYSISDEQYDNHLHGQDKSIITNSKRKRNFCRLIANISLMIGIVFLLLSAIFKIQSRSYISQAITSDAGCTANCFTTCYRNLPFYRPSFTCNLEAKQTCDDQCSSVGLKEANTYAILFCVFVLLGSLLMVIQIVNTFLGYCCYDYFKYKEQQKNQIGDINVSKV